jgi:hypothetical protein
MSTRCEDVSAELCARAHDDPSADDDPAILDHLEACPTCSSLEDDLGAVRAFWREGRATEIEPSPGSFDRLRARLETGPRRRRLPRTILALPAIAAAAAVLVFGLVLEPTMDQGASLVPRYGKVLVDGNDSPSGIETRLATGRTVRNPGVGPACFDLPDPERRGRDASFVLAAGTALRRVAKDRYELVDGSVLVRTDRPLRLDADDARVEVLGTRFALARTGDGVTVHVLEGHVALGGEGGRVTLGAGTRSFRPRGGPPAPPEPASGWAALGWLGEPRLQLRPLPPDPDGDLEMEVVLETDSPESIPIRPFTETAADFLLEIQDPAGRRFPLKILPAMVVERSPTPGHRATYPLVRGRPYRLRLRLRPEDLGETPGEYAVLASYNVRLPSGECLWQGRLTSEPSRIRR